MTLLCLCTCICQSVMEVRNGLVVEESAEGRWWPAVIIDMLEIKYRVPKCASLHASVPRTYPYGTKGNASLRTSAQVCIYNYSCYPTGGSASRPPLKARRRHVLGLKQGLKKPFFVSRRTSCYEQRTTCSVREDKFCSPSLSKCCG